MNKIVSEKSNSTLRELTIDKLDILSGADRGDATVTATIASATAGVRIGGFYGAVISGIAGASIG